MCREALSARIDGEREPVATAQVDQHVEGCDACTAWYSAAVSASRRLRLRAAVPGPDLAAAILDRVDATDALPTPELLRARRRLVVLRVLLAGTGVLQGWLGIAQLAGRGMAGMHAGHLLNESTAWTIALGIGMLYAAWRPRAVAGMIPVLAGFAALLTVFVSVDLISGGVTVTRSLSHLVVVAGLVLAVLLHRGDTVGGPVSDSEEIDLPPGARYGRRAGHLRSRRHPAA